jgi:hypothetical protein
MKAFEKLLLNEELWSESSQIRNLTSFIKNDFQVTGQYLFRLKVT